MSSRISVLCMMLMCLMVSFVYADVEQWRNGDWFLDTELVDEGNNGSIDRKLTSEYDPNRLRTTKLYDADNDGNYDGTVRYSYNSENQLTKEDADIDDDGTVDYSTRFILNSSGNISKEEISAYVEPKTYENSYIYDNNGKLAVAKKDTNGDGVVDFQSRYFYGSGNELVREDFDSDNNGTINFTKHYDYVSDDGGNIIEITIRVVSDGNTFNFYTKFEYDYYGNKTKEERTGLELGRNRIISYYNTKKELIRNELDVNNNGSIDEVETFTYENGYNSATVTKEHDADNDGIIDNRLVGTGFISGEKIMYHFKYDAGNDGSVDSFQEVTYDKSLKLISVRNDSDNDGKTESFLLNTYDINGNKTGETLDVYAHMAKRNVHTYTYDNQGFKMTMTSDSIGSDADYVETYIYNSENLLIETQRDYNDDNSVDMVIYYTYDTNNNPVKREIDAYNNGSIDEVSTYSWKMVKPQASTSSDGDSGERGCFIQAIY